MSRVATGALAAILLVCGAAGGAGAVAMEIVISRPELGVPIFGKVDVKVEVYPPSAEVDRVELFLDGEFMETATGVSPFVISIDAGEENRAHEILAVAYDLAGESVSATLETPPIQVDDEFKVELQQLYVTVESDGAPRALKREDFEIYDRNARQQIVTFERGDVPFTAVLLVDSSRSMVGEPLRTALRGARAFVDGMKELDEAKLLLFSDRILYETPFTSFSSVLSVGLSQVEAAGGTAINDFLYLGIERVQERQGRRVVVLLSDGVDVTSVLLMEQVRQAIRMNQAVLYWIVPPLGEGGGSAGHRSSWRDPEDHEKERELLAQTVLESGGRIVELESLEQTSEAFETVLRELRGQYVLGYYPPVTGRPGTWHKNEVKARDGRLKIRSRVGYYERPQQPVSESRREPQEQTRK
ncbi:MAG: VWA domain-containing protein [bacterium]|nr:VWA domain-containing protein [bacterium]